MKTSETSTSWFFYPVWVLSGVIYLSITYIISFVVDVFVFIESFGDTILVDGQKRITEDYMLAYAFVPWFEVVIGIMQYLLLKLRIPASLWWILTTTIGWSMVFLGLGSYRTPIGVLRIPEAVRYLVAGGITLGFLLGLNHWLILRVHVPGAAWWIPANMIGFGIAGFIFSDISSMSKAIFAFTTPLITTSVAILLLLDVWRGGKNYSENMANKPG